MVKIGRHFSASCGLVLAFVTSGFAQDLIPALPPDLAAEARAAKENLSPAAPSRCQQRGRSCRQTWTASDRIPGERGQRPGVADVSLVGSAGDAAHSRCDARCSGFGGHPASLHQRPSGAEPAGICRRGPQRGRFRASGPGRGAERQRPRRSWMRWPPGCRQWHRIHWRRRGRCRRGPSLAGPARPRAGTREGRSQAIWKAECLLSHVGALSGGGHGAEGQSHGAGYRCDPRHVHSRHRPYPGLREHAARPQSASRGRRFGLQRHDAFADGGRNGPATIHSAGRTEFQVRKRVWMDPDGLKTVPATATARTRTRTLGVDSGRGGWLLGGACSTASPPIAWLRANGAARPSVRTMRRIA